MFAVFIYSVLIMLASLGGVLFVWKKAGKVIEQHLGFLVSFSAGVFLIVAYQLGQEALEHAETLSIGLAWIFAGAVGIWVLFKIIPQFHHHHDEKEEKHTHSKLDARRILFGDAVHNIGDGILLAASFAISTSLGVVTALSVFIHELVQEVSEFFVLKQAGYSTKKALSWNVLISATILIGSLGGFFLLDTFEMFEVPLLGISAGAFLIVIFHDLIPHSVRTSESKTHYVKHVMWFVLGLALMLVVNMFAVHSHGDETHDHDHKHEHNHAETHLEEKGHHDHEDEHQI